MLKACRSDSVKFNWFNQFHLFSLCLPSQQVCSVLSNLLRGVSSPCHRSVVARIPP